MKESLYLAHEMEPRIFSLNDQVSYLSVPQWVMATLDQDVLYQTGKH